MLDLIRFENKAFAWPLPPHTKDYSVLFGINDSFSSKDG